jgi:hypothetical protein
VPFIDHLAHAPLPQAAAEEGEGAVELVAVGTSRVVARSVISLRVLVLTATLTVEHSGAPLPTMRSQTGHMVKGKANTAVVDEVEGATGTHLHGKTHVKVACAPSTALRVVATRVAIAPFCTSRKGVHTTLLYKYASCQHTTSPLHVVRKRESFVSFTSQWSVSAQACSLLKC